MPWVLGRGRRPPNFFAPGACKSRAVLVYKVPEMSAQIVILIETGQPEWPRWMIFHKQKRRYWSSGCWRKRRRDGDLWHDKAKADQELRMVMLGS